MSIRPTAAFESQCDMMLANARKWRSDNPNAAVMVQFNYPPQVAVISTISDAIDNGVVSANESGMAFLRSLWPWHCATEPTVNMIRVIIEYPNETER